MPEILNFNDVLKISGTTKRHLLLGNGFSIAWKPNIFQYGSLIEQADFSSLSADYKTIFGILKTQDFEQVIKALRDASLLVQVYKTSDPKLSEQLSKDSELLKDILVKTIASHHPNYPSEIQEKEYHACKTFLSNFINGHIFTFNYDLLLYWVLMHGETSKHSIPCDDGFRKAGPEEDYVIWDSYNTQNVYYLHGALHLFDKGAELEKFTWINTGIKLMDQVRSALNENKYPLVVTEGSSEQKLTRIMHSGYLHKGLRSFESVGGDLFIYGHSLTDNDDHFINLIPSSNINRLFVSIHDPTAPNKHNSKFNKLNELVIIRRQIIKKFKKSKKIELEIYYYDADSANVWR